jgi:drug/metabolite transporter (DMT)-like permease
MLSTIFFVLVKPSSVKSKALSIDNSINDPKSDPLIETNVEQIRNNDSDFIDKLSPTKKKVIGVCGALLSGFFYGNWSNPTRYLQDNYPDVSKNNLDHVLSFQTGILFTSMIYFIIYCIYKKNKPEINKEIVLPGIISGLMWGGANILVFMSINHLGDSIVRPITATGPFIVSSLVGVLIFKEIKGLKDFTILGIGFILSITGITLFAWSK